MTKKTHIELLTPVGRLVQGNIYEPNTQDVEGRPLTNKDGDPRVQYFTALAVAKGDENDWKETEWGSRILEAAKSGFPNGQYQAPTFAWKVNDGDSTIPNSKGKRPCDNEGFAGNWILRFTSGHTLQITCENGTKAFAEKGLINLGDYVQIYGNVTANGSLQQPGVFLNVQIVNFAGYGQRIFIGPDAASVGFGKAPLPLGVSKIPLGDELTPLPVVEDSFRPRESYTPGAILLSNPPKPYPEILNVPPSPTAYETKILTAKAQGKTYEEFIDAGWTDTTLVQHGYLL